MSLLDKQVDKNMTEFKADNNKEYKIEEIWVNTLYAKELVAGHLPRFY